MIITPEDYDEIRGILRQHTGIELGAGKEYLLQTRLAPVMIENNLVSYTDLRARMRGRQGVLFSQVIDALTTNETLWFRDASFISALIEHVLPGLIARAATRPVRIWSAACATGQEPYSLLILIREALLRQGVGAPPFERFQILATDLSQGALAQAEAGRYNQFAISRGMQQAYLGRYFQPDGVFYQVNRELRERVRFQSFNLKDSYAGLGSFDLVLCRNVLIYFAEGLKREILEKFVGVMQPEGLLALGASEIVGEGGRRFDEVLLGAHVFFRPAAQGVGARAPVVVAAPRHPTAAEKRRNARVRLELPAQLQLEGGPMVSCRTLDLSFGGALVRGRFHPLPGRGRRCRLSLALEQPPRPVTIDIQGEIVRVGEGGLGVRFLGITQEGYHHLRGVLVFNSDRPAQLLRELEQEPGVMITRGWGKP